MFEVPQYVFDIYNEAVDAMIDSNFGVTCSLRYPPEKTICTNCKHNAIMGASANIYNGTGPIPFTDGFCPYCNGDGFTFDERSEDIKLRCYFTVKSWLKLSVDVKVPDGAIQTIGHIEDLIKCKRCNYIVINTDQTHYQEVKYRLFGEPAFHGFKRNKYFIAFWERVK